MFPSTNPRRMDETTEPGVIIVQWDYEVWSPRPSFQLSNIQLSAVGGGQIVMSRDDHNHVLLAAAVGRLDARVARCVHGLDSK